MLIASLPGVPPRRQLLSKYRILLTYCPVFDLAALVKALSRAPRRSTWGPARRQSNACSPLTR